MLIGVTLTKCYTCTIFYLYIYGTGLSLVYRGIEFKCVKYLLCVSIDITTTFIHFSFVHKTNVKRKSIYKQINF